MDKTEAAIRGRCPVTVILNKCRTCRMTDTGWHAAEGIILMTYVWQLLEFAAAESYLLHRNYD